LAKAIGYSYCPGLKAGAIIYRLMALAKSLNIFDGSNQL